MYASDYKLGQCSSVLNTSRGGGVVVVMIWLVGSTTICDKVCQLLAPGRWFSPGPPASSTNITDRHDITEILLNIFNEVH